MTTNTLKLFIWQELPMSKEGYKQWSPSIRRFTRKIVFVPFLRIDADVSEINTKDNLAKFVNENCGEGIWIVRGVSAGKTKTHRKWVRLAKIKIMQKGDSYNYRIWDTWRLTRYWFWKKND